MRGSYRATQKIPKRQDQEIDRLIQNLDMDGWTIRNLSKSISASDSDQNQQLLARGGVKQANDTEGQRTRLGDTSKIRTESLAMFDEVNEGRRLPRLVHNLALFPLIIRVCVVSSTSISNSSYLLLRRLWWGLRLLYYLLIARSPFVRVALDFGSSSYPVLYTCAIHYAAPQ